MVWELEVGHTVSPPQGLPDVIYAEAFDDPATVAGFVDAMRWGWRKCAVLTVCMPTRSSAWQMVAPYLHTWYILPSGSWRSAPILASPVLLAALP